MKIFNTFANHTLPGTALCVMILYMAPAKATTTGLGLGFMLGEPTGFVAKVGLNQKTALEFAVGWGYNRFGNRFYDSRCYENGFYNNNRGYCNNYSNYYGTPYRTFHLHADYLFHNFTAIKAKEKFYLFYGPGFNYNHWFQGDNEFGARGVIGLAWTHRTAPFDIFFQLAPVLTFFPVFVPDMTVGLGARYYL